MKGAIKRLLGIWRDRSHALIELLQNADDADANRVVYQILPDGIVFKHNGHPFKSEEVKAICSIDDSTKDPDSHTGFMGIGFKSVFKLSSSPAIFSGDYKFGFSPDGFDSDWSWILIPKWLGEVPPEVGFIGESETVFWLPYCNHEGA